MEAKMGTSKKLHTKLSKMATPLTLPTGPQRGRADMPNLDKLIEQGFDPVHVVYVYVQNISSFFAEGVSHLPEMKAFAKIYTNAEDEYMPSGPPMSPLTTSFFTAWAFYDLRFDGTDTRQSSDQPQTHTCRSEALRLSLPPRHTTGICPSPEVTGTIHPS